jgi:hypothetical protein
MLWLVTLLQQSLSDGRITPASTAAQIVDTLVYPAMKAAGSKLNDSPIMHGFLADVVNRLFAGLPMHNERTNNIPSQPITLSVPASFAQPSTAQTAPPATLPPVTLPANAGQAPLIVPPAPAIPSSLAPNGVTPLIPQKSAADATELIQSMLAQNASQADAYNAAIAKLSQSGVAVTPQVQQAVAGEVQAQSTNTVPWLIGGLGVFALLVLSGRSRRHR